MTATISTTGQALRDTFRAWNAERDVIDTQLSESLAALTAYQSHLDEWQKQLACEREELHASKEQLELEWNELRAGRGVIEQERDELRSERNQLERDLGAGEKDQFEASGTLTAELNAARDKISALEEQKRAADEERAHWKEELRQLQELLQRRVETSAEEERLAPATEQPKVAVPTQAGAKGPAQPATGGNAQVIPRESPVLGSIVQQFDKLRQQRASDRQTANIFR